MTRVITYSLKANSARSDEYYRAISAFADSWLERTQPEIRDLVTGFREYRQSHAEPDRSEVEYAFELLALGVLLREHRVEACRMPGWTAVLTRQLVALQKRHQWAENIIKLLRGCANWIADWAPARTSRDNKGDVAGQLIAWLRADDETVKAERFEGWYGFFRSSGRHYTQTAIARCLKLAEAFRVASQEALGKYTGLVEQFLREEAPKHRSRYDARLLSRTRLEYHLGMLGTELLNRAYRHRFLATRQKMVIVPPCMCAPAEECKAVETPFGARCQACTPTCRVHQITKLGEKHGFHVTMIPDDVQVFGAGTRTESTGLVGVSCALTNWNGGWETGALGIPAQGLLLDYVGCKFHWDKEGIPTETNLKMLLERLGEGATIKTEPPGDQECNHE